MAAALAYRAQAPVLDGLMKELGLDGSSLDGLVAATAALNASASALEEKPAVAHAENDDSVRPAKRAKPVKEADVEAAE